MNIIHYIIILTRPTLGSSEAFAAPSNDQRTLRKSLSMRVDAIGAGNRNAVELIRVLLLLLLLLHRRGAPRTNCPISSF